LQKRKKEHLKLLSFQFLKKIFHQPENKIDEKERERLKQESLNLPTLHVATYQTLMGLKLDQEREKDYLSFIINF